MARRSDHTRDELKAMALAAAREIVATEGPAALSTRKVAAAIGYTAGSLYLVFENLDDLIRQINAQTLDELHTLAERTVAAAKNPQAGLRALAQAYIRFAFAQETLWSLVFAQPRPRVLPEWYQAKIYRTFLPIEALITRLTPNRSPAEIHAAARALWSGVHGTCVLALTERLGNRDTEAAEAPALLLVEHFLAGYTQASPNVPKGSRS